MGQSLFVQCSDLALLFHWQRKHGYFVYPSCCPSKKHTIFKSTQTTHLWESYYINYKARLTLSYVSLTLTEWSIGIELFLFPLCKSTHFKLRSELSINNLHSSTRIFVPLNHSKVIQCWCNTRSHHFD